MRSGTSALHALKSLPRTLASWVRDPLHGLAESCASGPADVGPAVAFATLTSLAVAWSEATVSWWRLDIPWLWSRPFERLGGAVAALLAGAAGLHLASRSRCPWWRAFHLVAATSVPLGCGALVAGSSSLLSLSLPTGVAAGARAVTVGFATFLLFGGITDLVSAAPRRAIFLTLFTLAIVAGVGGLFRAPFV